MNIIAKQMQSTKEQLPSLVAVLKKYKRTLILTHDNPDPDALASGFALRFLAKSICDNHAEVAHGGIIGRAENRAMMKLLRLKALKLEQVQWKTFDSLALVDHQPRRGFSRWPSEINPAIIIDHHPRRRLSSKIEFVDVRKGFGSNSTILTQYLQAANLQIPRFLATAMSYGIRSDTQEFSRGVFSDDLAAYHGIFGDCNHKALNDIMHPAKSIDYTNELWRAKRVSSVWDNIVTTYMGKVSVPDIVAEVADWSINIDGIKWSMAAGYHCNILYLSVRTIVGRKDAGHLLRQVVGRRGSAGGHGFMAGAQIIRSQDPSKIQAMADLLLDRFVKVVNPKQSYPCKPVPLIVD